MASLELAVIGNCQISCLLDEKAKMVWCCMPQFDAEPIFCSLLGGASSPAEGGHFEIELAGYVRSEQRYLPNTAMVETVLHDGNGGAVKIVDFTPRFAQYGRTFRPITLVRQVLPHRGSPRIRIRLRPLGDYGKTEPTLTRGSNHVRYVLPALTLRLTTDASITHLTDETWFVLQEPLTLVLGPDETLPDAPGNVGRRFFQETRTYWEHWTRGLSVPFEWQDAVIRAAITLKLCTFEDTGAVIAAMTTSIPEAPDSGRNWDYRYCWLRDAYFVVHALNRLGATRTMEAYLRYILDRATETASGDLRPVYGITGRRHLEERIVSALPGYRDMGPVRVGNQAHHQVQNDVYGSVILAITQYFFDSRLTHRGDETVFHRLEKLGERAVQLYDQPDAGPWEYRTRRDVHTFSSVMCWAACERLGRIATRLGLSDRASHWSAAAGRLKQEIVRRAWNEDLRSFVQTFDGTRLDASALLMEELHFLPAGDERFRMTVEAIGKRLCRNGHLFRYLDDDDFGKPRTSFNLCTFWYIDALASIGRRQEARELFEKMLARRNRLGLLSEDLDPATGELWGNFPQTYSMVGIIHAAMKLSKAWEEAM